MKNQKRVLVVEQRAETRKWPRPAEQPQAMSLSDLEPHLTLAHLLRSCVSSRN